MQIWFGTIKKTNKGAYGGKELAAALVAIENGQALLRVSKESVVPAHTLWRHRDSKVVTPGEVYLGPHHPALSPAIEGAVHDYDDHIKYMKKCLG